MKLIVTQDAIQDLRDIEEYIGQDNPAAAIEFLIVFQFKPSGWHPAIQLFSHSCTRPFRRLEAFLDSTALHAVAAALG